MHNNGAGASPEPSDDLLDKLAAVLGLADLFDRTTARTPRLVIVTVAGPTGRKVLQAPIDVPVRQLAAGLGAEVGAPVVAAVTVHGQRVAPSRTLGEVGVRPGSVIVVESPGAQPTQRDGQPDPTPAAPTHVADDQSEAPSPMVGKVRLLNEIGGNP